MKRIFLTLAVLFTLTMASTSLTSCREQKTTGEKIEDAVEETGDALEDAADDVEDAVEDAADGK